LNGYYIRHIAIEDLTRRVVPFLAGAGLLDTEEPTAKELEHLKGIVALEQERFKTLAEAPQVFGFFFQDPDPASCAELLRTNRFARRHSLSELREALLGALRALRNVDGWSVAALHEVLNDQVEQVGWKRGEFLMPIRIAVSGREATPPLFDTLQYVTRPATLRRLEAVVARLPQ
jgi:glutamyl/glutaminyl-tRNA synthetase